jgi:cobalt-zinc-cadmium efflux system protein
LHAHSHGHGHAHGHEAAGGRARPLAFVLALTAAYTVAEAVGGVLTGSLALLADAGHMLSDDFSLALALFAVWLAGKPATPARSFGYRRAEILAALANGVVLVVISLWIFVEAYRRFREPPEILGGWMLAVAAAGLAVNVVGAAILMRGDRGSLNLEAALRHVLADLVASIGVIVAGLTIVLTGWVYADPLVSVLVGLLVLASSWAVLRDSVSILLEATPAGMDANAVGAAMARTPGVFEVHDLHIWTITSGFPALSAHVLVAPGDDCHAIRRVLERGLHDEFGIEHTTLQVDHAEREALLEIETAVQRRDQT